MERNTRFVNHAGFQGEGRLRLRVIVERELVGAMGREKNFSLLVFQNALQVFPSPHSNNGEYSYFEKGCRKKRARANPESYCGKFVM